MSLRKDRDRIRRALRNTYRIARRITSASGGSGPWVFLVDPDPPKPRTLRLRGILDLRPNEDLWVELTFYPNKTRMKNIIGRIWKHPGFTAAATPLASLLSKRKPGFDATLAYAVLQKI